MAQETGILLPAPFTRDAAVTCLPPETAREHAGAQQQAHTRSDVDRQINYRAVLPLSDLHISIYDHADLVTRGKGSTLTDPFAEQPTPCLFARTGMRSLPSNPENSYHPELIGKPSDKK
jgi:hypothetical protein